MFFLFLVYEKHKRPIFFILRPQIYRAFHNVIRDYKYLYKKTKGPTIM
jgi:hypothetical protein